MRLGFVVLAHTDLHRVAQLARYLTDEDCVVSVHIDRGASNEAYESFKKDMEASENIILSKRSDCEWGRFSLVQATMDASEALLDKFPDVSHVLLISGSCLPIRPVRQLKRFLKRNSSTDYIESVSVENNFWVKDGLNEERFTLYFPFSWRKQRKLFDWGVALQRKLKIRRAIPKNLDPHIGSQWWCLTAKTLRAIIDDPKRPFYDSYFNWAWIPDESYFQTLVRLHSEKIESRSLTFSKFDYQGKPFVFYDDHLKDFAQSDCFWARKIWVGADKLYASLLDKKRANQPMSQAKPKEFDEKFEQADRNRCEGGRGRLFQGRYPSDLAKNSGASLMPYTVFVGFKELYQQFPGWVEAEKGIVSYGSVFARSHVDGHDGSHHFAGNLPAEPRIRNRNPKGYLANLFWANRHKHHSFLYSFGDNPKVVTLFAKDDQAQVIMIKHSWLVGLLQASGSFESIQSNARRFLQLEQRFISTFEMKKAKAHLKIIDLEEAINDPATSIEKAIAHIPGAARPPMKIMPDRQDIEGLDNLVRKLRNNGLRLEYEAAVKPKSRNQEETVYEKPYVVK